MVGERPGLARRQLLKQAGSAVALLSGLPGAGPAPVGAGASFGRLQHVPAGDCDIAYADLGDRARPAVLLLHGWPYDIHSFAECAPLLVAAGYRVIIPYLRGFGGTRFRMSETPRNGQQSALAADAVALMDALGLQRAVIAGFDWGARTANIIAALWPDRCKAMVSVSGYLIGSPAANQIPLSPKAEYAWWYQYYFATERGRLGYERNRREFARLIWELASPHWRFSDAEFERSARAFDNPDHAAIVVSNYRWRLGLDRGERRFDPLEQRLSAFPAIRVPTVTLESDGNGAPHPAPASYAARFTGPYVQSPACRRDRPQFAAGSPRSLRRSNSFGGPALGRLTLRGPAAPPMQVQVEFAPARRGSFQLGRSKWQL